MLQVPEHGSIEIKLYYTSSDFAGLFDLAIYKASRIISEIKLKNPDIIGEKIQRKPQQIAYDQNNFLLLVHHYDQLLESRRRPAP